MIRKVGILIFFNCAFLLIAHSQFVIKKVFDIPNGFNRELGEMIKDDEGFIWFNTNQGVIRFDGSDVKLLDAQSFHLPTNTTINHILSFKNYIVCSAGSTISIYDKISSKVKVFDAGGWVNKIFDNNHKLCFSTRNAEILEFYKEDTLKKIIDFKKCLGYPAFTEMKNIICNENIYYIFLNNGIWGKYYNGKIKWSEETYFIEKEKTSSGLYIQMSTETAKYFAFLYYNGEVAIFDKNDLKLIEHLNKTNIACVFTSNNKMVFIPAMLQKNTIKNSLYTISENIFSDNTRICSQLINDSINNSVLLSTNHGLVYLTENDAADAGNSLQKKIINYFKNKSVRSIYEINNHILIGSYEGFFDCYADTIKLIAKNFVYTIKKYNEENLLLGLEGGAGLAKYNIAEGKIVELPNKSVSDNFHVYSLYNNNGQWVCSSYNSIFNIIDSSSFFILHRITNDSIKIGIVRDILIKNSSIFLAAQNGLYHLQNNQCKKIFPLTEDLRINTIQETSDGLLLATSGKGIVKVNLKGEVLKNITFNDGLMNNFVYSMLRIGDKLYAGTSNGLSLVKLKEEMNVLPINNDNIISENVNQEFNHSAIFYNESKGNLILGGLSGVTFINDITLNTSNNIFRKALLSYVKTSNKNGGNSIDIFANSRDTIFLSPNQTSINLKFANPDLLNQSTILFRIAELNNQWENLDFTKEISIYSLTPGAYHLTVKFPFSNNPKDYLEKIIIVEPLFYQTIGFKLAIVFLITMLIFYWRWSEIKKIKRQEKMRTIIAEDLHDDIGSTLNSISVYATIATNKIETDLSQVRQLLEKMGTASSEMIDQMSDIVWSIHPKNDNFQNVLNRLKYFSAELLSGKEIILKFDVEESINKLYLNLRERKNIYLICKEAITNAYKYSSAKNITVSFEKSDQYLKISIVDDGKGFDSGDLKNQGNGIENITRRAKEISAIVEIKSVINAGTKISVLFLLRKHYTKV